MNRTAFISFIILLNSLLVITSCSTIKTGEEKDNQVRILSYNVRNCRGMDNITDYKRIGNVINRVAPDVVAIQELDSATQRNNGAVALHELATITNMFETYSPSIEYQGGKYGIGILTREKPLSWKAVSLPGREERRSLLIVELRNYIICCTHLSLTEEDRVTSVDIIFNTVRDYTKPVFIAGDFNAVPESIPVKTMMKNWQVLNNPQVPTIPSDHPSKCIDYIFGSTFNGHTYKVMNSVVEQEPVASDHLPVWVDVQFH
ncbi:MAG: endonuclease/exonuclease/phosphatase family protein [Methanococcaceae archaeon]